MTLIDYNGDGATSYWYHIGDARFTEGEQIVGKSSGAIATVSSVSNGSKDITSKFVFDDGQRDGYYDCARLIRKTSESAPLDDILVKSLTVSKSLVVITDVHESYCNRLQRHSSVFTARVDLGGFEPDGTFELSDSIDFRPSVGMQLGVGDSFIDSVDPVATSPTDISDYNNATGSGVIVDPSESGRNFESVSTKLNGTLRDSESMVGDISFYVPRIDKVFLHKQGHSKLYREHHHYPQLNQMIDDAIELFEVFLPAFT